MRINKPLILTTVILSCGLLLPSHCDAGSYDRSYSLYVGKGTSLEVRELFISIPPSIYEYYRGRSHEMIGKAKYVTPSALQPISEEILELCEGREKIYQEFTNLVLMIVQKIPYKMSPALYPVETLVKNYGDCDSLSYLAATMLKGGGLEVVLLEYEGLNHMNIGVHLPYEPKNPNGEINTYHVINGKKYYVAECTSQGSKGVDDWRLGECPEKFADAKVRIINLDDNTRSPSAITSRLNEPLINSTVTLSISPKRVRRGGPVEIRGAVSPHNLGERVILYYSSTKYYWKILKTLITDSSGEYSYIWKPSLKGLCYVRACYSGGGDYAAADSDINALNILNPIRASSNTLVMGLVLIALLAILTGLFSKEVFRALTELS